MPASPDTAAPFIARAAARVPSRKFQRFVFQRAFRYPHRNLLVIGQPKAGTTWLTRMVCEAPGYIRWAPGSIKLERHDFAPGDLTPPPAGYTVTKVHTPPTDANIAVIHGAARPYVVIIRDPRDLAVSWAYYNALPSRTRVAWPEARALPVDERIAFYIERILPDKAQWALEWRRRLHPALGMMIRYEDLLADAFAVMSRVYAHLGLHFSEPWVRAAVDRNAFKRVTGREQGQGDANNFNRKGIAGDWRNHFTPEHIAAFKSVAGEALIRLGYERDDSWDARA